MVSGSIEYGEQHTESPTKSQHRKVVKNVAIATNLLFLMKNQIFFIIYDTIDSFIAYIQEIDIPEQGLEFP